MGFIAIAKTLVANTKASASDVMANFNSLINGLSDGTKDIKVNNITSMGEVLDKYTYTFSKTAVATGIDISSITVPDNTVIKIETFGGGLQSGSTYLFSGEWLVKRTTSTCTIVNVIDDRDNDNNYITVVADGNNIKIQAFTNTGSWVVGGKIIIKSNNSLTIG